MSSPADWDASGPIFAPPSGCRDTPEAGRDLGGRAHGYHLCPGLMAAAGAPAPSCGPHRGVQAHPGDPLPLLRGL
eukprot:7005998-Heterocapsa_arctica.AAC.1